MNLFAHFHDAVIAALTALTARGLLPPDVDLSRITVEAPRDARHGDVTTNAAMVLAKQSRTAPRVIARNLADELKDHADIAAIDIAGPGFLNIRAAPAVWPRVVRAVLEAGDRYGASNMGKGEAVNVEYVSANPTGPLHVGHCRGAVFGDALANLLAETGYAVTREYYFNDAGVQIDILARSCYLRYRQACGEDIGDIPAGLYPGAYLKPVGEAIKQEFGTGLLGKDEAEWLAIVRGRAVDFMMARIRADLAALNIRHDVFVSERTLADDGAISSAIDELRAADLVYQGRLPPPKGQATETWENREQTLFRSTRFGDDSDRALMKSDGSHTYFAADVAYARDKLKRGFKQLIFVVGADHGGYVKRLQAVVSAQSAGAADAIVLICQLVKLFRAGEPVRMSKRAGDFVSLRDIVDEVGPDVVRFIMLTRRNDAPLDFDFTKVTEQSRDNPVFYVQYAHARICSVFRAARDALGPDMILPEKLANADCGLLRDEAEIRLIRTISAYPKLLETAAAHREPHRIAFYLFDLASEFHALWNKGKESPQLRFILQDQVHISLARLALVQTIGCAIVSGLRILGVKPVEEM